ncbi:hypothetical protein AMAG_17281 [Allomyces macrogynus ATCC 38327]|uniref:UDENN domain-containing protein n=1 Tax=Allomyces macrogynus (strain ATCC 38327) TaxID=578462 RepID=A0A0L0TE40_ALLM3|nr:hypothetical protein AMAG_17281 [Allomyces macrogynus ATCC 38327]|eukprot:KNE73133.1 hypothetical protein AMAG_17281 [Allomyces macrogynus ATCC 38327]
MDAVPTSPTPGAAMAYGRTSEDESGLATRHVDFILAAEFNIDTGSGLSFEYPTRTGTDERTLAELMLPDGAHQRDMDWTVFFLNQSNPEPSRPLLFVHNLVRTRHDTAKRRGATVKAMAVASRHQFIHVFRPVLILAMEKYLDNPCAAVLAEVYNAINAMDLSTMPRLTRSMRLILRNTDATSPSLFEHLTPDYMPSPALASAGDLGTGESKRGSLMALGATKNKKDSHHHETKIEYCGVKIPVRIPLTFVMTTEEVSDFSIIKLFNTFSTASFPPPWYAPLHTFKEQTHPILLLLNAMWSHKRVLFVGKGAGEVASYVLAACSLASGCGVVLRGFTERAFPYTCLANVDALLNCPGYIAGVTNPFFAEKTKWWDVCFNVTTGRVVVSPDFDCQPIKRPSFLSSILGGSDKKKALLAPRTTSFTHSLVSAASGASGTATPTASEPPTPSAEDVMPGFSSPVPNRPLPPTPSASRPSSMPTSIESGAVSPPLTLDSELADDAALASSFVSPSPSIGPGAADSDADVDPSDGAGTDLATVAASSEPALVISTNLSHLAPSSSCGSLPSPSVVSYTAETVTPTNSLGTQAIASHRGEIYVRSLVQAHVQRFVAVAAVYEALKYGTTQLVPPPPPLPPRVPPPPPAENESYKRSSVGRASGSPLLRSSSARALARNTSSPDMADAPGSPRTQPATLLSPTGGAAPKTPASVALAGFGAVWPDAESRVRDLTVHAGVIDAWRGMSPSYGNYIADIAAMAATVVAARPVPQQPVMTPLEASCAVGVLDVQHHLDMLRQLKLDGPHIEQVYDLLISHIVTDEDVLHLLSLLPLNHGGLMVLSPGLFHPLASVRTKARRLLGRIDAHSVGAKFMGMLNAFVRFQYLRGLEPELRALPPPGAASP